MVYANPRFARRQSLWEDLGKIGDAMDDGWMVFGCFNSISSASERKGGAPNFATRGKSIHLEAWETSPKA